MHFNKGCHMRFCSYTRNLKNFCFVPFYKQVHLKLCKDDLNRVYNVLTRSRAYLLRRTTAGLSSILAIIGNLSKNLGSITIQKSLSTPNSSHLRMRLANRSCQCSFSSRKKFCIANYKVVYLTS